VKKKLHYTANSFMTEVKVSPDHVGMFLSCWLLLIIPLDNLTVSGTGRETV